MNISNYTYMNYDEMTLQNYLVGVEYESFFISLIPILLMLGGFVYGAKKDFGNGMLIGAVLGLISSILFNPLYIATNHSLYGLGFTTIFSLIILITGVAYTFIAGKQYQTKRLFNIAVFIILLSSLVHPLNITIDTNYIPPTNNPYIKFTLADVNGTANCTVLDENVIRDSFTNLKDSTYYSYINLSYGKNLIRIDCTDLTKSGSSNVVFSEGKEIISYNTEEQMQLIFLFSFIACFLSLPLFVYFNIFKYKTVIELGIYSLILITIIIIGVNPMNYYFGQYMPLYFIGFTIYFINLTISFPLLITNLIDEYKNRKLKE